MAKFQDAVARAAAKNEDEESVFFVPEDEDAEKKSMSHRLVDLIAVEDPQPSGNFSAKILFFCTVGIFLLLATLLVFRWIF